MDVKELIINNVKSLYDKLKKDYDVLQGIKCSELKNQLPLLNKLTDFMRDYYKGIRDRIKGNELKNALSDTLVTKILMGTLGCIPAYDRYFIEGIKKQKVSTSNFNNNSIIKLIEFYKENETEFDEVLSKMSVENIPYPQMKFLDMGFWEIGFRNDTNNETKIEH